MLPIMFNVSFLFQNQPTPSAPAHGPLERLGHRFEYFRQLLFKYLIQLMLDPSIHIYLLKTENQHLTWWQGNAKKQNPPKLIQYKIIISIDPWKIGLLHYIRGEMYHGVLSAFVPASALLWWFCIEFASHLELWSYITQSASGHLDFALPSWTSSWTYEIYGEFHHNRETYGISEYRNSTITRGTFIALTSNSHHLSRWHRIQPYFCNTLKYYTPRIINKKGEEFISQHSLSSH